MSKSLSESAYEVIKRAIISCEIPPGGQVTEGQLNDRFKVGRAAVRTALSRLCQEGFMQAVARQGYIVAPTTIKGVRDLFAVRVILEPAAAELAAQHPANLADLPRLDRLCQTATYDPSDRGSVEAFLQANTQLHLTIVSATGNERLTEMIAGLLEEMERLFHLGLLLHDRNDEMYHEHHDLCEALLAGDGQRAKQLSIDQIRSSERMVVNALLASPNLQSVNLGGTPRLTTVAAQGT